MVSRPPRELAYARARVASDPLCETAHADVVRLLGSLGRAREALAHYDACRRVLERELGVRPSLELESARTSLGLLGARRAPESRPGAFERLAESLRELAGEGAEGEPSPATGLAR